MTAVIETLDDIVSGDKERMRRAFSALSMQVEDLSEIDAVERKSFDRLGRQLHEYDEWPESEQRRFMLLARAIRNAFIKQGVIGNDGWPIRPK